MRPVVPIAFLILVGGCSAGSVTDDVDRSFSKRPAHQANANYLALADSPNPNSLSATQAETEQPVTSRRIIYQADIEVIVKSFDGIEQEVRTLVDAFQGYIAKADLGRMQGEQRSGSWVVRIPVDDFDAFLTRVEQLGIPTSRTQNAQDVSEEFVDLEARIDNKRKLESRIQKLLERPDDKIQHVIEVERELARVREDIERFEGRLRYLTDKTAMTTVTIAIREEREYTPPQSPTLTNRVSAAWSASIRGVVTTAENLLVFAAGACVPLSIVVAFFWLLWKAFRSFRLRVSKASVNS